MADAAPKDVWDRLSALAGILVPAAIALAGHFISQGLKQAEIANEGQRIAQARLAADSSTKIAQANLVNTLMKSLTSTNPNERRLAVHAVMIAMPEQGVLFARAIAIGDEDPAVQDAAKTSIEQRVDVLARDLFADDKATRVSAAQELVQGWREDPAAVSAIVAQTRADPGNVDGVYNSAVVLEGLSTKALAQRNAQVVEFVELTKSAGEKTQARVQAIRRRAGG